MLIKELEGRVFRTHLGDTYGILRRVVGDVPRALRAAAIQVLAEDECGNYFILESGQVSFWDHETSQVTPLAGSLSEFAAGLVVPTALGLAPEQVISAWIDPAFAKALPEKDSAREP